MDVSAEKQHAHDLIERLEPSQIAVAVRLLERVASDPVARAIVSAPVDDEPLTPGEEEALDAAEAWLSGNGGKGIPHEEILAEFGLTDTDFRQ